jgi:hypothetical protein
MCRERPDGAALKPIGCAGVVAGLKARDSILLRQASPALRSLDKPSCAKRVFLSFSDDQASTCRWCLKQIEGMRDVADARTVHRSHTRHTVGAIRSLGKLSNLSSIARQQQFTSSAALFGDFVACLERLKTPVLAASIRGRIAKRR